MIMTKLFFMETANQRNGKVYIGVRVREEGPYNHSEKSTLTLSISGGIDGELRVDLEQNTGITVSDCYNFINMILVSIGCGTPRRRMLFTMDNLLAHKNRAVIGLVILWGHIFFRAPYHPVDGAVEYVFNNV